MALTKEIIQFAEGNTDFYEGAVDFYHNPSVEKNEILNKAFFAEVERKSGVNRDGLTSGAWIANPQVHWASLAIVDATINAILPKIFTDTFGVVADLRTVGAGDVVKFRVRPNSFFTVSLGGRGERTSFRQKKHAADVTVAPIEHIVTVYVDMYSVLAGKEDIGEFIRLVVESLMQAMYGEAIGVMQTGLAALPAGDYNYSGAFDMAQLVTMCERIQAENGGVSPVIAGSATALMNVLPDSTLGYRGNYDANGGAIDLIRNVYGFDVLRLDQAVAAGGGLILPSNQLYIVSPSQDKLIKGVLSTDLTNSNDFYDNADLTQNYTQRKGYGFAFATAAKAGIYTITD